MTEMWVSRPGTRPPRSPRLLKAIEEQQAEIDRINSQGDIFSCRICGSKAGMTKEHSPAKAAFNKSKLIGLSADKPIFSRFLEWKARILQGGNKHNSLCRKCNNNTGSWYNASYVKFVRTCSSLARPDNAFKTVNVNAHIYPGRLFKQALTHIVSTSQPGLALRYNGLKEMILSKEKISDITPIRLGLFIRVNKGGRQSGVALSVRIDKEISRLIAEFSFWPLGWIMTFDNSPFEGTLDVTSWSSIGTNKKVNLDIEIPCQWCVSPYPGDFRSPAEVFNKD